MSAFSYKEMLTNQLMVFINQRIATSKDMQDKVNSLTEEKKKKFQQKIVESIINKAKSLAEIQGTQYLGMMGDSGEKEMLSWVDTFFDEFESNMKDPEKPKTTTPPTTRTSIAAAPGKANYATEDGLFGLEISIDKKTKVGKEEFIERMNELYKGEVIKFEWKENEVIVEHHKHTKQDSEEGIDEEVDEDDAEETESEDTESEDEDEDIEDEVEEKPVVKEAKPKKEKVVKETKPKEEKPKVEKPKEEKPKEDEGEGLF